jgi:hypothetical protein
MNLAIVVWFCGISHERPTNMQDFPESKIKDIQHKIDKALDSGANPIAAFDAKIRRFYPQFPLRNQKLQVSHSLVNFDQAAQASGYLARNLLRTKFRDFQTNLHLKSF